MTFLTCYYFLSTISLFRLWILLVELLQSSLCLTFLYVLACFTLFKYCLQINLYKVQVCISHYGSKTKTEVEGGEERVHD